MMAKFVATRILKSVSNILYRLKLQRMIKNQHPPKMQTLKPKLATALTIVGVILSTFDNNAIAIEREGPESCHLREIELCIMGFISIFQNPNGLPVNPNEINRQCEYFKDSVQCLDSYNHNCLTTGQLGVVYLFAKRPLSLVDDFCRQDSELRANYTKHVNCFRGVQRKLQRSCLIDFQVGFEAIHKLDRSQRPTVACCNLNRLKECFFGPINDHCGAEGSEFVERLLMDTFGTWFTLPCRSYVSEDSDCKRLLSKPGTKPHSGRNISALSKVISGFTNVPA